MAKRRTFSKLRNHLTSTELDERASVLENITKMPTNNTAFVFQGDPSNPQGNSFETITDGETDETDYSIGENPSNSTEARDTTGLFNAGGDHSKGEYVKTVEPPGDTSYVLGPMAAMYYTWSYPWTMVGYIRESDRKMVNLGRIDGKLSDWDGSSGNGSSGSGTFYSYGQLTTDQAIWFRDIQKANGNTNDPATYSYRAFYPGPPSATPDAFGRYPCILTGVSKKEPNTHPDSTPLDKQAGDNFSAMLKNFLGKAGAFGADPFAYLKRLGIKSFFELGKFFSNFTGIETSYGMANAYGHMNSHYDNNNPLHPDFRKHDPSSDNYEGPKEIKFDNKTANEVTNQLDTAISNLNNGNGPKNGPNGNLTKDEIKQIDDHMNQPFRDGSTEGWAVSFYNTLHSLPPDQTNISVKDGKFDKLDSNYRFTDPRDANPIAVDELIYGNADFTNFAANMITGIKTQAVGNGKPKNDGGFPFYEKSIDEHGTKNNKIIGTQYNTQSQFSRPKNMKESLSLERKREIFGHLTKPVLLPETKQKTYKVSPGQRYKDKNKKPEETNFQDMDKLFNKNIGGPQPFKPQERTSWTKDFIAQNVMKSQEKMNGVLEMIGDGKHAFDYATNDYRRMGAKELEQYWGKNPNMYSFMFNGKKYNVTRKEHVEGDLVVFMEDQKGVKSNMLQSELNEKLEEENERWIREAYFKSHPVIPDKEESTYDRIKARFLENKKIAPEFPAEPPPKMVNGFHPQYGKNKASYYKKLDPASANAMPETGDPEIDAIVRKQKTIKKIKKMAKKA